MTVHEPIKADGRRQRSQTSRDKIVLAMLALVGEGEINPSAEQVASRAEVGLRTVFRHFKDMETLYAAMTEALARQYDVWRVPFGANDWRGQLHEAAARRMAMYERLLPFKRAGDAHRHISPAIQAEHRRTQEAMRQRLMSLLPMALLGDAVRLETIDLMLSIEVWQRLRDEQHLPVDQARAIILGEIERLTAGI